MTIKSSGKRVWPLILMLATFAWTTGCSTWVFHPSEIFARHSDPLVGWHVSFSQDASKFDQTIQADYQNYLRGMSQKDRNSAGPVTILEDGTGQHAIKFETGENGTSWGHVLIYDKNNKRVKVIKYVAGHYGS